MDIWSNDIVMGYEKKVTVVIPIYNVQKYLNRCIESVIHQTYRNLEIILVDDGSPDECPAMCDVWAEKDSRIKVIHKQNQGLGMARNTGIDHATGDYICFFDSDDYVDLDTISNACALAEQNKVDLVIFGMSKVNNTGVVVTRDVPRVTQCVYVGAEVRDELLPMMLAKDPHTGESYNIPSSACSMLISMELIHRTNWRFVSEREIISEDIYSLLNLFKDINKAAVLKEAPYYYCSNSESLTRTYRADRYQKYKLFYKASIMLCQQNEYSPKVMKACAGPFLGATIEAIKQTVCSVQNIKEAQKIIQEIIEDEILQKVLEEIRHRRGQAKLQILVWAMRRKNSLLCYLIVRAHIRLSGEK